MKIMHPRRSYHDVADKLFLVLAALTLPMLWLEYAAGVSDAVRQTFHTYFLMLWALFAAEFAVRLFRARNRRAYLIHNWIEVVIVFFPFLRVLQLFRPAEIALVIFADRFARSGPFRRVSRLMRLVVLLVVIVAVSSELVLLAERSHPDSGIQDFGDALWWSTVGITTIGIGNVVPVSAAGKILTLGLAVVGVFIFSILTAHFADMFITEERIQRTVSSEQEFLRRKIAGQNQEILERLGHIERELEEKKT